VRKLIERQEPGVHATTLEANAAMKSIVWRDNGAGYDDYLRQLMQSEGVEEPTPDQRQRFDRKRKKSLPNRGLHKSAQSRVVDQKDRGRPHALGLQGRARGGLDTRAVVALTVQPRDRSDTKSLRATLGEAWGVVAGMTGQACRAEAAGPVKKVSEVGGERVVADKGYRSKQKLQQRLPQQTEVAAADRGGSAHTYRRTRTEAATMGGAEGGAGGGVCQPAAAPDGGRQGADAASRGTDGEKFRSSIRDRRDAAGALGGQDQPCRAPADSRCGLQPEPAFCGRCCGRARPGRRRSCSLRFVCGFCAPCRPQTALHLGYGSALACGPNRSSAALPPPIHAPPRNGLTLGPLATQGYPSSERLQTRRAGRYPAATKRWPMNIFRLLAVRVTQPVGFVVHVVRGTPAHSPLGRYRTR
jgi:hypothetical protein